MTEICEFLVGTVLKGRHMEEKQSENQIHE